MAVASAGAGGPRRATKALSDWRWIEALRNPLAGVAGIRPHCLATCDMHGDGTSELVAACPDAKLRVLDGRSGTVTKTLKLLGEPSCLTTFYPDTRAARVPAIAVACGASVFVYRNLRPFFKFALPALPVNEEEASLWTGALEGDVSPEDLYDGLARLQEDEGAALTITSAELLALDKTHDSNLSLYIEEHRGEARELRRQSVVTCMTSIAHSSHDARSQSQLVIGTEHGDIIVLSPAGTAVEARYELPGGAVPASVHATGLWQVDSRLVVHTRDGTVRSIRNKRQTSTVLRTGVPITDVAAMTSAVVAATMDGRVHCWHPKGKPLWVDEPPSPAVALCRVTDPHASREVVAVALADGDVRLYAGGVVLHSTGPTNLDGSSDPDAGSAVSAMVFGSFGRESRCLVTAHQLGSVRVRVLPRRARLDAAAADSSMPPEEQDQAMDLPKRTRLHVQNVHRERAEAGDIWRSFERDRRRVRLSVLREYVKVVASGVGPDATDGSAAVSSLFDPTGTGAIAADDRARKSAGAALRAEAEVRGVGPRFDVVVTLTSALPVTAAGARLLVEFDPSEYEIVGRHAAAPGASTHVRDLPTLAPRCPVVIPVSVRCVDAAGAPRARIRLTVLPPLDCDYEPGRLRNAARTAAGTGSASKPLVSIAVEMPQAAEPDM